MPEIRFEEISPIGDTDAMDLPVPDLEAALPFYIQHLGMTAGPMEAGPPRSVTLTRDGVSIRLAENGGDPHNSSCYIGVSDVQAIRQSLAEAGQDISEERIDDQPSGHYRVFFVRAPDGLCFCIGTKEP
ncbi:MAG: hypothetical protein GF320_15730 [Armatimonadia bacterium]|nr:hypothetical protein [Armatimonadia bacterium]